MSNPHAVSPSSPRLPSPPPLTEDQVGPKSPTTDSALNEKLGAGFQAKADAAATRRIRPGTKAADMTSGPPLIALQDLDSPFQLQEHLKALHYNLTHPPSLDHTVPITRSMAEMLAEPPSNIDRSLWLYELCRFLTMRVNTIIIHLFSDTPACSAQTCPEMRASEWQYLCAVHDPPKSCCAIDYCCHTLDWAGNILTSPKHFPSRLTLGSETGGGTQQGVRQLTNIFRRLYRIFAHAWFQHRHVFWQVEGNEGLYVFFKTVSDAYNLIPEDNYTVPPEAERTDTELEAENARLDSAFETPSIFSRREHHHRAHEPNVTEKEKSKGRKREKDLGTDTARLSAGPATGNTSGGVTPTATTATRRHKPTPSTGSAVMTVVEEDEDDKRHEETEPFPAHGEPTELPAEDETQALVDQAAQGIQDKPTEKQEVEPEAEQPTISIEDHSTDSQTLDHDPHESAEKHSEPETPEDDQAEPTASSEDKVTELSPADTQVKDQDEASNARDTVSSEPPLLAEATNFEPDQPDQPDPVPEPEPESESVPEQEPKSQDSAEPTNTSDPISSKESNETSDTVSNEPEQTKIDPDTVTDAKDPSLSSSEPTQHESEPATAPSTEEPTTSEGESKSKSAIPDEKPSSTESDSTDNAAEQEHDQAPKQETILDPKPPGTQPDAKDE